MNLRDTVRGIGVRIGIGIEAFSTTRGKGDNPVDTRGAAGTGELAGQCQGVVARRRVFIKDDHVAGR